MRLCIVGFNHGPDSLQDLESSSVGSFVLAGMDIVRVDAEAGEDVRVDKSADLHCYGMFSLDKAHPGGV